jgi:hypothetical protein
MVALHLSSAYATSSNFSLILRVLLLNSKGIIDHPSPAVVAVNAALDCPTLRVVLPAHSPGSEYGGP